jgi:CRISPR-associated endoribonuclease Cas6
MIIASPSTNFIEHISYQLQKIIEHQIPIDVGSIFELERFVVNQNKNLSFPLQIITGSPILIRITIEKFRQQSTYSAPYRAIYWRYSHPIELFIDAVESNLKKKYYDFTNSQINGRLFESFKFKKQVSTRLHVGNSRIPLIGSLWEFGFFQSVCEEIQLFALDTGLGQRNSLGFGFMNPVMRKT